jgi:hypothetical protein
MGQVYEGIDDRLREFLVAQPVFFVATAPNGPGGHVNVSPKGMSGTFAVLGPHRVAYLDYTGSGAETIAHLRENGRITLMFCAFQGPPSIVRLHGRGEAVCRADDRFAGLVALFGTGGGPEGQGRGPEGQWGGRTSTPAHNLRAVIVVDVERVSDSCGFAVPLMSYVEDRDLLTQWASRKSDADMAEYWASRNATSLDGLPALPDPVRPAG